MEPLEKKVLQTACTNLLNSTSGKEDSVPKLQFKIATMQRGINDAIALIETLMENEPEKKEGEKGLKL